MVNNKQVAIRSDFRSCLKINLAYESQVLGRAEKQAVLLAWFYPILPPNVEEAFIKAVQFLNQDAQENEDEDAEPRPRVFSFEKDSQLIYAAFKQTHDIDLQTAQLHWYQFLALFGDLHPDTSFCQLRNLRYRLKTGKATKEERQAASEIHELIELPDLDMRSYAERLKEKRFMEILNHV